MIIVSGDNQTAEVGSRLPAPLVVRVADTLGAPAARIAVRFRSTSTEVEESVTTDAQGLASVAWTLDGHAGTQEIVAHATVYASSPTGSATLTFTARGTPGEAAAIIALGGHGAVAAPGAQVDTVTIRATDRFGNATARAPVAWSVFAGGGTIRPLAAETDTLGIARAVWVLGPAEGEQTLDVTVGRATRRLGATASLSFPARAVVAGSAHTCALSQLGAAYCWGSNLGGQLGIGAADGDARTAPARVAGGHLFAWLVAGGDHTCGLTAGGQAYCWGNGRSGQLGSGFLGLAPTPTLVRSDVAFTALAAGALHTCGLATDRTVYCWGDNSLGQLGASSSALSPEYAATPVWVQGPGGDPFTAIAAGAQSTCAITALGAAYCWGSNASRELGGDLPGRCHVISTQFVYDGTEPVPCSSAPVRLEAPYSFASLAASGSAWCAVSTGAQLICWGLSLQRPHVVVAVGIDAAWVLGLDACAQTGGSIVCWNVWRRTGLSEVRPFGNEVNLGGFASGKDHWCGVSRDTRGVVYCWGSNASGQLGDGTTASRTLPVAVHPPRAG